MSGTLCRVLGHDWDQCTCQRCGVTHDWNGCACRRCGTTREHQWGGCTCGRCGTAREHEWAGCACRHCGAARQHEWAGCTCRQCGAAREHDWAGCACDRCGALRDHEWDGCRCTRCGVTHDWDGCTCRRCGTLREHDWDLRGTDWLQCACRRCRLTVGEARPIEALILVLTGADSEQRFRAAAEALGRLSDARAVAPLIRQLQDEDDDYFASRARAAAADALGNLGDAAAIGPLIRALGDPGGDVCRAAVSALDKLGESTWKQIVLGEVADADRLARSKDPRALEPLLRGLAAPYRADWEQLNDRLSYDAARTTIRCASAKALGELGDPGALEALFKALGEDEGPESYLVREAAAHALGELGDPRAVDPLARALEDREEIVRKAAAAALTKLHDTGRAG